MPSRPRSEPTDAAHRRGSRRSIPSLRAGVRTSSRGSRASRSAVVLIGGPTGTGKERIAAAVHAQSRRKGAFVPVNCAALPAGLVESELFGHKKGAFSGAIADACRVSSRRRSWRGTLFLDEIG